MYWFANIPYAKEPDRQTLAAVSSQEWRRQLTELFADDATPAADLIRSTHDHDGFIPTILHDLHYIPLWHRESMVLV